MFNDITTLLLRPGVFKDAVDLFVERYRGMGIDAVAGNNQQNPTDTSPRPSSRPSPSDLCRLATSLSFSPAVPVPEAARRCPPPAQPRGRAELWAEF